jgi:hypothetical protein
METFLYIPINSLNVNNVLASESVSPPIFYERRGFGFKRFERILSNPHQNSFVIYSKFPVTPVHRSDREEYPVVLAIPSSYISNLQAHIKADISVYQCDKTIYLNWDECVFIFRNEEEKIKSIAATNRSLEVKHADKYIKQFVSLDKLKLNKFDWSDSVLENIQDCKSMNSSQLNFDQKINKIKGLVYGFAAGKLRAQSNEMLSGRRYYQDFINAFSVLLNDLSVVSSQKSSYANQSISVDSKLKHLEDLTQRINILFGANEVDEAVNALSKVFNIDLEKLNELNNFKYLKTRTTILGILTDFIKEKDKELYTINELLENLLHEAKRCARYGSPHQFKKLEQDFEQTRNLVSKKIASYQNNEIDENQLIEIPFAVSNDSVDKSTIQGLTEIENKYLTISINEVLIRTEMSSSDEIAQQRLDIIKGIADRIKELENIENSFELEYLRKFHKSLKTVGVGFKVQDSENKALQGLACFLSRYSELEKLQDFMEKNNISDFSIGYSLWGASYGYSNLSKILLTSVERNEMSLKLLNDFLNKILVRKTLDKTIVSQFLEDNKNTEVPVVVEWRINQDSFKEPQTEYQSSFNQFENAIKANKKLNKEAWIKVVKECSNEILEMKLPDGPMFGKDYKVSEFHSLLTTRSKKIPGFGSTKIDEATKLFKEFLS